MSSIYQVKRQDGSIREGLTAADLCSLAKLGELRPTDMVARVGENNWTFVTKVKGLPVNEERVDRSSKVLPNRTQPKELTRGWRDIVHECRHFVPLIESRAGQGSGLLISHNGLVVTNRHVIEGARVFMLSLYDGTKTKAILLHQDADRDLATIKSALNTKLFFDLQQRLAIGFDAGDEVIAIGHPRGLTFTSTRGIVSEPHRLLPDGEFVQTDVAINPGNSGGPLFDQAGNLVGLNTQIQRDSQGLGFAIPGEQVALYVEEVSGLIRSGKLRLPSDEELSAIEEILSPSEILAAALRSRGLECTPAQLGGRMGWRVKTPDGATFSAIANEKIFLLTWSIATLNKDQKYDALLLNQLLRWQSDHMMVRFTLDENDFLQLEIVRSGEDLDMSEVLLSLSAMVDAVDFLSIIMPAFLD